MADGSSADDLDSRLVMDAASIVVSIGGMAAAMWAADADLSADAGRLGLIG
jgi:hypothetical protein